MDINKMDADIAVIELIDWQIYEDRLSKAISEAIALYSARHSGENVYQMSVWTDGFARASGVAFETKEHADFETAKWVKIWLERNDQETADRIRSEEFNGNPADFKYRDFFELQHPEMDPVKGLRKRDNDVRVLLDQYTERHLLVVRQKAVEQGLLLKLPREDVLWFGISSPKDWYDHVIQC